MEFSSRDDDQLWEAQILFEPVKPVRFHGRSVFSGDVARELSPQ